MQVNGVFLIDCRLIYLNTHLFVSVCVCVWTACVEVTRMSFFALFQQLSGFI